MATLVIQLESQDPYYNLAAEEHFFKTYSEDIFMVYRNLPAVIIGKNQNANAEINLPYVHRQGIPVVRRMSGGGTVYHDLGNVNYVLMKGGETLQKVDFPRYMNPVVRFLREMGVQAELTGISDISVGGRKVSGNAEHLWKNRLLHHGTLLFSSELAGLGDAIRVQPDTYMDRAVQSNRKQVTNIATQLPEMSIGTFVADLLKVVPSYLGDHEIWLPSPEDDRAIRELVAEKYSQWAWNYARSPGYVLEKSSSIGGLGANVRLRVAKGLITEAYIDIPAVAPLLQRDLAMSLVGLKHHPSEIVPWLEELRPELSQGYSSLSEWLALLF